jgi:hypothetical protein
MKEAGSNVVPKVLLPWGGGETKVSPREDFEFRPSEMAFPAFWESSSEDCVTLIKYLTKFM